MSENENNVIENETSPETQPEEERELTPEEKEAMRQAENNAIRCAIRELGQTMKLMESLWTEVKQEFGLTDNNMKALYEYNLNHRKIKPDDYNEEENGKWDNYNGLDDITEQEVVDIFGEGHIIIHPLEHSITVQHIKESLANFIEYLCSMKEYKDLNDEYMKYTEASEEESMNYLRQRAEQESDPEKKAEMLASIDEYYKKKTLGFMADPIPEKDMTRLVKAYSNAKTLDYYIERSKTKLTNLGISPNIILEISKFENRFLPEKYHKQSNTLLLYFMSMVTFCRVDDPHDKSRSLIIVMTIALDNIIRKTWDEKYTNMTMDNIMKFEDQFLDKLSK